MLIIIVNIIIVVVIEHTYPRIWEVMDRQLMIDHLDSLSHMFTCMRIALRKTFNQSPRHSHFIVKFTIFTYLPCDFP